MEADFHSRRIGGNICIVGVELPYRPRLHRFGRKRNLYLIRIVERVGAGEHLDKV